MNKKSYLVLPAVLALLTLLSCTSSKPYRIVAADCSLAMEKVEGGFQRSNSDPGQSCAEQSGNLGTSSFYRVEADEASAAIGIVEFDDQGYVQDPSLYRRTLEKLEQIHAERGALMIVFAHGWKHNADFEDSNLVEFEKMLMDVNLAERQDCERTKCQKSRETVGVFLAWRGLSVKAPGLSELSFWNRKKKAQRVGQDGAIRLLADLDVMNTRACPPGECGSNRFIIVGHSFGGAIIYGATRQRITADLASPTQKGTVGRSVADLIVLVNPAFEAARYWGINNTATQHDFPDSQRPILAIYTSENDKATKKYFKWGRTISTLFVGYNDQYPNQKEENRTALGHYGRFQTHRLNTTDENSVLNFIKMYCDWEAFRTGASDSWRANGTELIRKDNIDRAGQYTNPYMVVSVDEALIADHSKIWESQFRDHLFWFMLMQNRYKIDCDG